MEEVQQMQNILINVAPPIQNTQVVQKQLETDMSQNIVN